MHEKTRAEVISRLMRDYEFQEKKSNPKFLRAGTCPDCGEDELFTSRENPWVLICPRANNCGTSHHVKDLYPEIFEDWSKRTAEETKTNPQAAADAYMSIERGFDLARIKGWYTQGSYHNRNADSGKGAGTATVRFVVAATYWERLIDKAWRFEKKAHFAYGGGYAGHWWCPPTLVEELHQASRIYITEGIFNAIALYMQGYAAVSCMSSGNYPEHALAKLAEELAKAGRQKADCELVWALDSDPAGKKGTKKFVALAEADGWRCAAAQVMQVRGARNALDWNDLHLRGGVTDEDIKNALYLGALLIAKTPTDKALLMYHHSGKHEFALDHNNRLYWFKVKPDEYQKAIDELQKAGGNRTEEELKREAMKKANTVVCICDAVPRPLYYQANKVSDESWYFFSVEFPHDGAPVKGTFSAAAINSAAEFGKRITHIAPGVLYTGTTQMLLKTLREQIYNITRVETVDYVGYSLEHDAYILGDVAVSSSGKVVKVNKQDYFDLDGLRIKSLNQSVQININPRIERYSEAWVPQLWAAFGAKGYTALAFWMGSLLAEQIRNQHKFFPFLEIVGQASAGKTTLIEFLWKLIGREGYEGFDPQKSTPSGRARNLAQVSNMPVVLIESDRETTGQDSKPHHKSFDWDELKTAFNGRSPRARGMATSGNETYEPPFRGAIVISQNAPVVAGEAILTRICHVFTSRADHRPGSRDAAIWLGQCPTDDVSGFSLRVASRSKQLLATVANNMPGYVNTLRDSGKVQTIRIAECHGLLLALADALASVVPMTAAQLHAVKEQITNMATERQTTTGKDTPAVAAFWDAFEYLDSPEMPLNHSSKDGQIWINLNHFYQVARERSQPVPDIADVRAQLETSRRYRFIGKKNVKSSLPNSKHPQYSLMSGRTLFCWVFEDQDNRSFKIPDQD